MNIAYQGPPPIHVLPELFGHALQETVNATKAPVGVALLSQLTAAAAACQGLIDVQRKEGLTGPCNIFALVIADKNSRKSSVEKKIGATLHQFDNEQTDQNKNSLQAYEVDLITWKQREKVLCDRIKRGEEKGLDISEYVERLKSLYRKKPVIPKDWRVLIQDTTPEALKFQLKGRGASLVLWSDEAGNLLNGRAIKDFAFYNSAWGGATIQVDRRSSESYVIEDARLSIAVMLQPTAFREFHEKKGESARGSGLYSRFLFCEPMSNEGFRFINNLPDGTHYIEKFNSRVLELLNRNKDAWANDGFKRQLLKFTPEAQERWIQIFNNIESQLSFTGALYTIKDYAAKYPDNLARVAAVFHYFQGKEGDISLETLNQASTICEWFLQEFQRLFAPPPPMPQIPQLYIDANLVESFLIRKFMKTGVYYVFKAHIQQGTPKWLNNGRLMPAIHNLVQRGIISTAKIQPTGKHRIYYDLNKEFFDNAARSQGYSPD